ncbi:unnamed protein product [Closterium sp. Yama58-4]|nr:unnamed protein product [Closterium sp. Yama58-4]
MARRATAKRQRDAATSPYSLSASLVLSTSALALSVLTGAWLLPRQLWGVDLTSEPLTCIKSTCALFLLAALLLFSLPPFLPFPSVQRSPSPTRGMQPKGQLEQLIAHITTAIVLTCIGAFAAALAATAFGAPITLQSIPVTIHWSSLLSLLAVLPSALLFGSHTHLWRSVLLQFSPASLPEACVVTSAHGAVVGAWIGAWPMPLDWEQPWQVC